MLRRSRFRFCASSSSNNYNNKGIRSSFPSITSHFSSPSPASARQQQDEDDFHHHQHRFHRNPTTTNDDVEDSALKIQPSNTKFEKTKRPKPVDVAFMEDENNNNNNASSSSQQQQQHQPYDVEEGENVSRFGDVLHERMRELKAEKHRDFKITTHIASRKKDVGNKNDDDVANQENDENFFSLFDDVESELQSGASSALNQLAAASSQNNFNVAKNEHNNTNAANGGGVMLARAVARAGVCSRRAAINLVASGKVKIDGVVQRNPFELIHAHNDIHVDGHRGRLRFTAPRLWAYHKPSFVPVSSNPVDVNNLANNSNSRGIFRNQYAMWERYSQMVGVDHLMPIGSMPVRSHGLLMLTNDGELARWLEHSTTRVQSTWIFRVRPAIDSSLALKLNTHGVNIGGQMRKEFQFINFTGGRSRHAIRIKVQTPEGEGSSSSNNRSASRKNSNNKNHQRRQNEDDEENHMMNLPPSTSSPMPVTQMLEAIGRRIVRGGRVGYGPFTLRGLAPGGLREVSVPPYYMKFINPVWAPFIERDWPYFRRERVKKLTRLARWRHLNDREQEEIESLSCDELRKAFESGGPSGFAAEFEAEAKQFAEAMTVEPNIEFTSSSSSSNNDSTTDNTGHQQQQVSFKANNQVDFEEIAARTTNDSKQIKWNF